MRSLIVTVAVLALLASWALLGRSQATAQPIPGEPTATATRTATATATRQRGYLPLIIQPASPAPATSTATATRTTVPPTPTATIPAANCDPSYPGVCIPPPPPDLNCGDIPERRFTVLPPDPHGFDTDEDGIGCETL